MLAISRMAYFYSESRLDVCVELFGMINKEGPCGPALKSMYGAEMRRGIVSVSDTQLISLPLAGHSRCVGCPCRCITLANDLVLLYLSFAIHALS